MAWQIAEDPGSVPRLTSGSSQPPGIPVSGLPIPSSSGLHRHYQHTFGTHKIMKAFDGGEHLAGF